MLRNPQVTQTVSLGYLCVEVQGNVHVIDLFTVYDAILAGGKHGKITVNVWDLY